MDNLVDIFENENKDWSVYGQKPKYLDGKIWSKAIEYEVIGECFDFFNPVKLTNKAQGKYNNEKEIILKSLKAIFFNTCPYATLGKSGQIYLFFPSDVNTSYVYTMADGELSFVGTGTVCIITPKNENVLYIIHQKLGYNNLEKYYIRELSVGKINKAITQDRRINIEHKKL
jgi:hypothetical protein